MKKFLQKHSRPVKIISVAVLVIVFYFAGYLVGHKNLVFDRNYKPVIANRELMKPRSVDFGVFWQAWNKVADSYVGTPDYQKMINGAISGMIGALGDPYSVFMEQSSTNSFLEDLSGTISGIGAQIDNKDGQTIVVAPLKDSPAEQVGLKPNDQILKIDDKNTEGMNIEEAVGLIRGKEGTKVSLTIMREGFTEPKVFEITRAKITVKSVNYEIKADNIAYISISQFGDDTTDLMKSAAKDLSTKNVKGIVLDLRNNPGGYLESAVDVSGIFLPKGSVVVKEKYKSGKITEEKTKEDPILPNTKIVILVNKGSASASEIVAGALQDYGRAVIVGETSFGKGSVQDLEPLTNSGTLRLTIAKWLTPKDRIIDKIGITPDNQVGLSEEDVQASRDPQLDKAIEMLK